MLMDCTETSSSLWPKFIWLMFEGPSWTSAATAAMFSGDRLLRAGHVCYCPVLSQSTRGGRLNTVLFTQLVPHNQGIDDEIYVEPKKYTFIPHFRGISPSMLSMWILFLFYSTNVSHDDIRSHLQRWDHLPIGWWLLHLPVYIYFTRTSTVTYHWSEWFRCTSSLYILSIKICYY